MPVFQYPNKQQCHYYRFEKEYFEVLKDLGIIAVRPSNWKEELVLDEEEASVGGPSGDTKKKNLEQMLEDLMWKTNVFIILSVVCVIIGCVLMYAVNM